VRVLAEGKSTLCGNCANVLGRKEMSVEDLRARVGALPSAAA
jgi:hypothetical protein